MTVTQLIEVLQGLPGDFPVTVTDGFDDRREVWGAEVSREQWVQYGEGVGDWVEAKDNEHNNPDVKFRSAVHLNYKG